MDRELSKDKHPRAIRSSESSGVLGRTRPADFECKEDAEGYFEQRLPEESMDSFEAHLLGCRACTAKLEAMLAAKAEVGSLADQIRGLPDSGGLRRFAWWKLAAVAACSAVVVAAISISIYSKKNKPALVASVASAPSSPKTIPENGPPPLDKPNVADTKKERIDNLPLNLRNYVASTLKDSGANRRKAPIGSAPNSGLNVSGARARSNDVTVDGADAVDNSVSGARSTASQEAVQESHSENRPKPQPQGDTDETPTLTAAQGAELYRMAEVVAPPYTFSGLASKGKLPGARNEGQYSGGSTPSDTGRQLFQNAMAAYVEKRYGEAGDLLESAAQNEPKAVDTNFYWGVCELLLGHPQDSLAPLKKAVAAGNSPYLQSAHYYLAKAYLQEERFNEAAGELRDAAALSGRLTSEAKSLLARTQALQTELEKK